MSEPTEQVLRTEKIVKKIDAKDLKTMLREMNREVLVAARGLPNALAMTATIAEDVSLVLFGGITEEQLRESAIEAALQNIQNEPE